MTTTFDLKFHGQVTTKTITEDGVTFEVGTVPFRLKPFQLGQDKTDRLRAPYGLSRLFPGAPETHHRNLELRIEPGNPRVVPGGSAPRDRGYSLGIRNDKWRRGRKCSACHRPCVRVLL